MIKLPARPLIRPADQTEHTRILSVLQTFDPAIEPLPGIVEPASLECLAAQIIESSRRRRFVVDYLDRADIGDSCLDPSSGKFDPIRAAILHGRAGDLDEACWLIFLSVHFGHHRRWNWGLVAAFYGRVGASNLWTWTEASTNVADVRTWLDTNSDLLRAVGLGFGNHRKYESLSGSSGAGTGSVIASYVDWVCLGGSRGQRPEAVETAPGEQRFRLAYKSMAAVHRFGRTARFDYLTMLGKAGVFPGMIPDSAYLAGSTGPLKGARLLLEGTASSKSNAGALEKRLIPLRLKLDVTNDVLEDALCNWQKSPNLFVPFRG